MSLFEKEKIQLRDYQSKMIADLKSSLAKGNKRIICQMHVGAGKTVVSAQIVKNAADRLNRSLFLAPRRQLVYQTVETFQNFDINTGIIMAGERPFTMPFAQVGSIDTVTSRVKSGRMLLPDAKILLVDECHAIFSPARLEFLKQYPIVIGITATPCLANGKGMGEFYQDIVEGPTMAEMVENGYLVPMRYFGAEAPDVTHVKKDKYGEYDEDELAKVTDTPELVGAVYENYKRLAGDRTTLIFAVNRKHAVHIHDEFKSHGVEAEYLDGETPTEERVKMKHRVMTGQSKVVINIGVMAFGTDWPIISCVIVDRVVNNIAAWFQMVGRGSRLYPGKEDTIVIYHGSNFADLGPLDQPIEWSLDGSTIKERREKLQKESKEPKDIQCKKCGYIFRSSRICPSCKSVALQQGESIPHHEADLVELKFEKKEKFSLEYKENWYRQMLGYCRKTGKKDGFAFFAYKEKFGIQPAWKKQTSEPTEEITNWLKHRAIKKAKSA